MTRRYISNEIIHWTGRIGSDSDAFRALSAICNEEILRLTVCPRYVQEKFKPETAMVCFTDVPLHHSGEHCGKFGRFGIAFHKHNMIAYGANPVFYTVGLHLERIKEIAELTAGLYEYYRDREWREDFEPYQFTDTQFLALHEITEFSQEYSYRNADSSDYVNYYQREWRLTFNSLKFAGGLNLHSPGKSCIYIQDGKSYQIFKFSAADVAYIIVPWRYFWRGRNLAKKLKCGLKIYEVAVGT